MFCELIRRGRPVLGLLLLGTVYSIASPSFAACDVTGRDFGFAFYECDVDGVNIKLTGPSGTVTLDDFLLDPTDAEGYVQVFATDTEANPTDITVNLTGNTVVTNTNYDGLDIRTVRGDIAVNIGEDSIVNGDQTGVFVESIDLNGGSSYAGGDVVINNYGLVTSGPDGGVMGSNGIVGRANAGAVTISNYGTVTTSRTVFAGRDTYGILADGGFNSSSPVEISVYNNGDVTSFNDAIHINAYNGLARAVNDVDGTLVSTGRRAVSLWSRDGGTEFENYGSITAEDGPAGYIWSQGTTNGYASVINGGSILAYSDPNHVSDAPIFVGLHIWSQVDGTAELTNLSAGSIVARDGYGAFLQSANGDVIVDNAGLIKGQYNAIMVTADDLKEIWEENLEDYQGAQGGDISITNSGVLTAFGLAEDGAENRALVTIAGVDLGSVELRNNAGGVIGAGIDLSKGFDTSLLSGSASDLNALQDALGNYAVKIGAEADEIKLTNYGTILGRMSAGRVASEFGAGPGTGDDGYFFNYGLWATSGESLLRGTQNNGTIWAQGEASVSGDLNNGNGTIVLAATSAEAAHFVVGSGFAGHGTVALNIGAGAVVGGDPLFTVTGGASGSTTIEIMSLDGWDWIDTGTLDVAQVLADSLPDGESTFVMEDQVRGLALYQLNYADDDQLWSIEASVSQQSIDEVATLADVVSSSILDVSADLLDRTDLLRDGFWSEGGTEPMGYAATAPSPADDAFEAALATDGQPAFSTWARSRGAVGGNDDYAGQQGSLSFGADIAAQFDDVFVAGGVFGALGSTGLDYDASGSQATVSAQAIGAYGTAMWASGMFVTGVAALETAGIDLTLSGADAAFDAALSGGRIDVGYRTSVGDLDIEPSVGLSFGRTQYDDFDMSGTTVSLDDADTLAAEARLRLSRTFETENATIAPFAILTVGNRSVEDGQISLDGLGAVGMLEDGGLYGGLSAGLQLTSLDGTLSGFARADLKASEESNWMAVKLGGAYRF